MMTEEERYEHTRARLIDKLDRVGNWLLDVADILEDGDAAKKIDLRDLKKDLPDIFEMIESVEKTSRALAKYDSGR